MHVSMHCFQNALAYHAAAVSHAHKSFMKLTPVMDFMNILCLYLKPLTNKLRLMQGCHGMACCHAVFSKSTSLLWYHHELHS
jgi:hypothetical protein